MPSSISLLIWPAIFLLAESHTEATHSFHPLKIITTPSATTNNFLRVSLWIHRQTPMQDLRIKLGSAFLHKNRKGITNPFKSILTTVIRRWLFDQILPQLLHSLWTARNPTQETKYLSSFPSWSNPRKHTPTSWKSSNLSILLIRLSIN